MQFVKDHFLRYPAVKAYTDPVFAFLNPAAHSAPDVANKISSFPPGGMYLSLNATKRLVAQFVPVLGIGGAPLPGVYTSPTQASANICTNSLRTHFATPPGAAMITQI